jgi:NAD(P)-dependent dehydrogenase (short-subunit alcohol dehydrogenase family)
MAPRVFLVIGAGDATGGAITRRFAREGYEVCVARRTQAALRPSSVDWISVPLPNITEGPARPIRQSRAQYPSSGRGQRPCATLETTT